MTRRLVLIHMIAQTASASTAVVIKLPKPELTGRVPVERCLAKRRSVRTYRAAPLSLPEVGQLLWAAQGVTAEDDLRAAPSAGALYPMETYVVAGNVQALDAGVYRYRPGGHDLILAKPGDLRAELARAAIDQECVRDAPASLVFVAEYRRTTVKYGQRGLRYVYMEAGHAAENVYLQAAALALGTVAVGAFRDVDVKRVLALPEDWEPLYLMPVGRGPS
jgi:SagB-type dehydrogenase family enzyme